MVILFLAVGTLQGGTGSQMVWRRDLDSPICTVGQDLGSSSDTLEITRTPANDQTELKISLPPRSKVREGNFRDGAISIYPGGQAVARVAFYQDAKRLQIFAISQDPAFVTMLSNASTLQISDKRIAPIQILIRSAAVAAGLLRECEDERMRAWGINPNAWRALKARPTPLKPVSDLFRTLDYPKTALAAGVEADVVTRLDVTPGGRVNRCAALNAAANTGFEKAACAVLTRARFQPALNAAGAPVSAPYLYNVRFRIAR